MTLTKGSTDSLSSPSPFMGEGRGEGLLANAKKLRGQMTEAEKRLWCQLRAKRFAGYKFRRQAPIGKYIPDFVCYQFKLIIELDGGQHAMRQNYDQKRDEFFIAEGFHILRFWNNEVLENMEGVLTIILRALREPPLPNPLPQGERELELSSPSPLVGEGRGEGGLC